MSATLPLAVNTTTGRVEHIDDAKRENKYHCGECREQLTVVQGKINEWHFRHQPESTCTGKYDRALHDYAVDLLLENMRITIAENYRIDYHTPQKEQWIDKKRSDVKVICNENEIHFEIVVSNDLNESKLTCYANNRINCVRIDLTDREVRIASKEQIRYLVLEEWMNKELLNWNIPKRPLPSASLTWWEKAGFLLLLGIAIEIGRKVIAKRKKRKR